MAHTLGSAGAVAANHLIREGTLWDGRACYKLFGGLHGASAVSVHHPSREENLRTVVLHASPWWRRLDGASAGKEVTHKGVHKTCCKCG